MLTKPQKLIFLNLIKDDKEVLLGKLSPTMDKEAKNRAWQEVYDEMVSHGVTAESFHYLRDVAWPNLKRSSTTKIQQSKATGAAGVKLTPFDLLVEEIIGKDSAYFNSTQVADPKIVFKTPTNNGDSNSSSRTTGNVEEIIASLGTDDNANMMPGPSGSRGQVRIIHTENSVPIFVQDKENIPEDKTKKKTNKKIDKKTDKKRKSEDSVEGDLFTQRVRKLKLENYKLKLDILQARGFNIAGVEPKDEEVAKFLEL